MEKFFKKEAGIMELFLIINTWITGALTLLFLFMLAWNYFSKEFEANVRTGMIVAATIFLSFWIQNLLLLNIPQLTFR